MKNESPQSIIEYVGKSDHECLFGGKKLNAIARLEIESFFVDIILKKFNIFLPLSNNNILNPPRIFLFFSTWMEIITSRNPTYLITYLILLKKIIILDAILIFDSIRFLLSSRERTSFLPFEIKIFKLSTPYPRMRINGILQIPRSRRI